MTLQTEIAVVGGGPSGAVIAFRLAQLGHEVVLIVCPFLPRSRGGETFTPGVAEQLAFLDLGHALGGMLARRNVDIELRWHSDCYEPYTPAKAGLLVNRAAFDAELLAAVAQRGVNIQAVDVQSAERIGNSWRLAGESRIGPLSLIASILVDATGRRGLLPKRRRRNNRLLALYGRWRGRALPSLVRVTTGEQSWAWGAPADGHAYDATLFLDPRDLKAARGSLEQRYCTLVRACGLLDGARSTELAGSVQACDATPYIDVDAVGADFLKIGDACASVDPLSSAGVQIAIQSAVSGAAAVHTLRRDPTAIELVSAFWSSEVARRGTRNTMWSAELYRAGAERFGTPFWRSRAALARNDKPFDIRPNREPLPKPSQVLRLSDSLGFSDAPCVVGNIVERRRTVTHPSLSEPVAFLGGVDLPALLARIFPGMKATAVLHSWSSEIDPNRAIAILSWIWRCGLLESAAT